MSDAWCRMLVGDRAALVLALAVTACVASAADPGEPTLAEEAAFRAAVARVGAAVVRIEPVASAEAPGSSALPPSSFDQ